jgi:hypothetical protein
MPSALEAENRLKATWGPQHFARQMGLAEAALEMLERTRGGRPGALRERFEKTGVGNHVGVIRELARLGGFYAGTHDPDFLRLVDKFAKKFSAKSAATFAEEPDE